MPSPPGESKRLLRAEANHQALLRAATHVFATKGFEPATVAEIASLAGLSVGSVYLRHANKTELLIAVLDLFEQRFVDAMSAPSLHRKPWPARLDALFGSILEEATRHPELPALMQLAQHHSSPQSSPGAKIRTWIAAFLSQGQTAGAFRALDPEASAAIAYGMVDGALQACFRQSPPYPTKLYARLLADAAKRWVLLNPEAAPNPETVPLTAP